MVFLLVPKKVLMLRKTVTAVRAGCSELAWFPPAASSLHLAKMGPESRASAAGLGSSF